MAPKRKIAEAITDHEAHESARTAQEDGELAPLAKPQDYRAMLRSEIMEVLGGRRIGATCCPSEIPRRLFLSAWREHMEETRQAAFQLADEGIIEVTQKGEVIHHRQTIKGPIRLRLKVQALSDS